MRARKEYRRAVTSGKSSTIRPTRAEQRAATQAALLDAAIESLLERGYGATTTRDVAERAGVSQGAQQNYFPTKASLVLAALTRWFKTAATEHVLDTPVDASERERIEHLLDWFWEIHLPVVAPTLDFLGAERHNPDVVGHIAASFNALTHLVHTVSAGLVPETARLDGFGNWLNTALAAIRGTAVFIKVGGIEPELLDWKTLRAQLLHSLDALIAESGCRPRQ